MHVYIVTTSVLNVQRVLYFPLYFRQNCIHPPVDANKILDASGETNINQTLYHFVFCSRFNTRFYDLWLIV